MALVRCDRHGPPRRTKHNYVRAVKPVGYPTTAAICGRQGCINAGLVWLTEQEHPAYERGERIFSIPNAAVRIRVE